MGQSQVILKICLLFFSIKSLLLDTIINQMIDGICCFNQETRKKSDTYDKIFNFRKLSFDL